MAYTDLGGVRAMMTTAREAVPAMRIGDKEEKPDWAAATGSKAGPVRHERDGGAVQRDQDGIVRRARRSDPMTLLLTLDSTSSSAWSMMTREEPATVVRKRSR